MVDLPLIMTSAGPQPTAPATIKEQILTTVEAQSPGYTGRLPGILIEDISSTDVAAAALCDQARVDTVNSLTPLGANAFLLLQMGELTGVSRQDATNTSVQVVFTGTPNFVINPGFTVSDGVQSYYALDGGIIGPAPLRSAVGTTSPLTFIAENSGSWAVPPGTVTEITTSYPSTVILTCTNPAPGTPGNAAQTEAAYRDVVVQAWRSPAQGTPSYIKSVVSAVAGVNSRLVAVRQESGVQKVIVGGSYKPNDVAYAIYCGVSDPSALIGSSTSGARNNVVDVMDFPDVYRIIWVSPVQQVVTATVTWNTSANGYVNTSAIQQLAAPALAKYVNAISCGLPLNLLEMKETFVASISSILAAPLVNRLIFQIALNGVGVTAATGLEVIPGDPEGYFWADPSGVGFAIIQG